MDHHVYLSPFVYISVSFICYKGCVSIINSLVYNIEVFWGDIAENEAAMKDFFVRHGITSHTNQDDHVRC